MADQEQALEHKWDYRPLDMASAMRRARDELGVSLARQVIRVARASHGPGLMQPREVYTYGPDGPLAADWSVGSTFVGADATNATLFDIAERRDVVWTLDKQEVERSLREAGLPASRTLAQRPPQVPTKWKLADQRPPNPDIRILDDLAGFEALLADEAEGRLFGKPNSAIKGMGAAAIEGYDAKARVVLLEGGRTIASEALWREIERFEAGYVLQRRLRPHQAIAGTSQGRIASARLLIHQDRPGAIDILRAVWKIPGGDNPVDNFARRGNLVGAVDIASGEVGRVVDDIWPNQRRCDVHPDHGAPLKGVVLPDWGRLKDVVRSAAALAPELRMQSWDVAITDQGPVLVEVEAGGGQPLLTQLAHGEGLLRHEAIAEDIAKARRALPSLAARIWSNVFPKRAA